MLDVSCKTILPFRNNELISFDAIRYYHGNHVTVAAVILLENQVIIHQFIHAAIHIAAEKRLVDMHVIDSFLTDIIKEHLIMQLCNMREL